MSTEHNREIFRRIVDQGLNERDEKVLDEAFGDTLIDHDLPPGTPPGPAGTKAKIAYFVSAFPDVTFTFESDVAEGDRIAGRGYFTGTHRGDFQGIAPTGKRVKVDFQDVWRFEDGKVVEYWGAPDLLGLLRQLGALPPP